MRRATLGWLFWLCVGTAWAIPSNQEIRRLLADRVAKRQAVGIVVGIVEPGGQRVVAYGKMAANDPRTPDGNTVFQIGSVTKVFTTLLLAEMVERGDVHLDDPAVQYLSGMRMPRRGHDITLRDLASHVSGLPSMPTNFDLAGKPNPYESYSEAQLDAFLSGYELPREPGAQFEYSNLGVALLGQILARRAGKEYASLLTERVLQPLGMHDTTIELTKEQKRRLAPGHDLYLRPVAEWNLPALPGSGALRSTATDMLRFLAAYLGVHNTPALAKAMAFQLENRTSARGNVQQSLGWQIGRVGGEQIIAHDGGKPGYRSYAAFNPRARTGIVILANARSEDRLGNLALYLLTGRTLRPTPDAPPVRRTIREDRRTLDSYAGEYQLAPATKLTIARAGDHLLVDTSGEGIEEFFPEGGGTYFCNIDNVQVTFVAEHEGTMSLVWRESGQEKRARRIAK